MTVKKAAPKSEEIVTTLPLGKGVHPLIKIGVAFHVLTCTIWALPKPSEKVLRNEVQAAGTDSLLKFNHLVLKENRAVIGYLLPTGFWQYWDMFAPDPSQTDFWGDAEVIYFDGTRTTYQYPRMFLESIPKKYVQERFRKFYERAHLESNAFQWPVFAQRIALLNAVDSKNPPIKIVLRRHWQDVIRHDAKPGTTQSPYNSYAYYTHVVDQQLLRQDLGIPAEPSKKKEATHGVH